MKFGLSLPQGWNMELAGQKDPLEACEAMTRVALTADEVGFASAWLVDHFQTVPRPTQEMVFECWTTSAALARDTRRIRIGQMVSCNEYRNPALLAKMASTVDVLSHGRLTLGLGAGAPHIPECLAYGYEDYDAPERLRHLREAAQVILAMWTQEEATFEGKYYQVRGAINQPKGLQQPHIPLLIGGNGEQVTLKLVAQYANACNVHGDSATITRKFATLRQHCATLERPYESIYRTAIGFCSLGKSEEEARDKIPPAQQVLLNRLGMTPLVGTPATVRAGLRELEEAGVQELILSFPDALSLDNLRRFADAFIV
jgi:F420-dependent oxidoreductase-like protein